MAAVPGQEALGAGAFRGHGGDAVGGLAGGPAGLRVGALAHDAERLAGAGEGSERLGQQVARGDAARLDAPVRLRGPVGVAAHAVAVPVDRRELGEGVGAVRLDRQHVVRAVRLDDGPRGVAGRVQRVQGGQAASQVDVLEQGAQDRGLVAGARPAPPRTGRVAVACTRCVGCAANLGWP